MGETQYSRNREPNPLGNLRSRRRKRTLSHGDTALHPAAGPAFTIWQETYRQFPHYSLVSEEATLFAISQIPMPAKRVRGRLLVFGGFEAYTELQELPTEQHRLTLLVQEFAKISDLQVEEFSLKLLMVNFERYSIDGSIALEQMRQLIKTSCRPEIANRVLSANCKSQSEFAASIDVSVSRLKRQASRLKNLDTEPTSFIDELLSGESR